MDEYDYVYVDIKDLLLNEENPRFDSVSDQAEIISSMLKDQKNKIIVLAKDITGKGLNPTDPILVKRIDSMYLVREGNRRVTALKLIENPSLIPSGLTKYLQEFNELNKIIKQDIFRKIRCVVIDDDLTANEWIRLKHTGENQGAGTVKWDSLQTSRFTRLTSYAPDMKGVFFDELRENSDIPKYIKDNFSNISKTNFDRLLGDTDFREIIGVSLEDTRYHLKDSVTPYLLQVLTDLVQGKIVVRNIYHKKDRERYINELHEKNNKGTFSYPSSSENEEKKESSPQKELTFSSEKPNATRQGKSYSLNRKTLIPSEHVLVIKNSRILKIFRELKNLDINSYTNAVSVLFRVFIELSIDEYASQKNVPNISESDRLRDKIETISSYMEEKSILKKQALKSARMMASSNTATQSIQTFHCYVHNRGVTPVPSDLKSAWDDLWIFIQKLWS